MLKKEEVPAVMSKMAKVMPEPSTYDLQLKHNEFREAE